MTCSDADKNCPIIDGSIDRFSLPFDDPKTYDNTEFFLREYEKTGLQIATEIFYVFSKI